MSAKILIFDLENAPHLGYTWSKYQQDVIKFERESFLLSVAWKWYGESKTHCLALPDFAEYEKNPYCDKQLCQKIWELLDEADVTVGHNSIKFDHKKIAYRMAMNGLPPHSPVRMIDTLRIARRHFSFPCNRLDSLCKNLGIGGKIKHTGSDLWFSCLDGDPKAWALMKRYNKHDVVLTEKLYERLRPYSEDTVHVGLFEENPLGRCPCCGSTDLVRRGYKVAATRVYRQYQCKDCGRWSRSVMSERDRKADLR